LGAKLSIFIGTALSTIGIICVILFGFSYGFYGLLPGFIISGIGLGFAVPSITTAAIGSVSDARASLAGGIVYMFQLVGGAFGLAVVTTIFTDFAKNDLLSRISASGLTISDTERSEIISFIIGSESKDALVNSLGQEKFSDVFSHIHHAYVTGVYSRLIFTAAFAAIGAYWPYFLLREES